MFRKSRMKSESPPYEPVYHFSDPHLFLGFIGSLARRTLIAPVKNDEKLRNLYFPGFRVTQSKPTQNQLLNAYKREILQRRNSQLANLLSKKWIEAHSDLTSVALTSIGIATEDPLAVNNWLEKVHEKLTLSQGGEETVRCVVTALSERFPPDDVRIVWRQLLFPVSDNYFSRRATTTSFSNTESFLKLVLTGAEDKALQGCTLSAASGARPGKGGDCAALPVSL